MPRRVLRHAKGPQKKARRRFACCTEQAARQMPPSAEIMAEF
jgi:hypothetical protein